MPGFDVIIIVSIVLVGLFIFYKALKEPIDLLLHALVGLFSWGKEQVGEMGGPEISTINYG